MRTAPSGPLPGFRSERLGACRCQRSSAMDILRPTLIRIGGRVYRKNLVHEQVHQQEEEDEDFYAGPGDCADEPCDAFVVEETEKGFQCRVEVPSPLYKYVIGKKGETKKRLETETRTSISIPKPGVEGEIVITGQQRSGVISARTRIDVLLDSFRKKQPFTHFLSFALNQPAVQEKFLQFKEEVLEKCAKDHGVSSSLFQNPAKLHLTLGTLVLLNEQEIRKACDLLQRCKEDFVDKITGGRPLAVEVAGVEYMNDDPAMTDVLYAKVHMKDGSDRLQVIADQLVERFVASGLMLKEWDRVKLHATVMNTLFRKDPGAEERNDTTAGKSSFKERESFNGRNILKDDYIRSWEDGQSTDEALDTTKDPCQKVKCSRHKVCVAQGYQRAMCISRKKLEHRIKQRGGCKPCHAAPLAPVCGSDGHTYSSACKLEQQACLAGKQLTARCEGQCPCPAPADSKQEPCTGQDLADLGERLRDWFQLLRENAKHNGSGGTPGTALAAGCKEAVGWMFGRLDTSGDRFLEQPELAAINLDKYEACVRAFFNSCDASRDGRVSAAEWCFCFWREKPPCLRELEKLQMQEAAQKPPGAFIPSCDEDGYYRRAQCAPGGGECWCVDQQHGTELSGTRARGRPDCEDAAGFSGDFGSSVGWEDEEEKEPEEAGEEAEEEEAEAGEGDDGGYIW